MLSIGLGGGVLGGNRLWYLSLGALPVNGTSGALDLARYDMRLPAERRARLPLVKLVDDLRATWAVVVTNNTQWTLHTSFAAARFRCGLIELFQAARILGPHLRSTSSVELFTFGPVLGSAAPASERHTTLCTQ